MRLLRLAAAVLLVCTAGATATEAANMPDRIVLTEQNQGKTVDVHVGQPVVVSLPENATTGYRWTVDRLDGGVAEAGGPAPRYQSGGAVGSGGRVEFTFRPRTPGRAEITLKQWRPWEGEGSVVGRFEVTLRIVP